MTTYDEVSGLPTAIEGPNGVTTTVSYAYDTFGRLLKVVRPGDTMALPTLWFTYADDEAPWIITRRERITSGESDTLAFINVYDGLGRVIQGRRADANRAWMIVSDSEYDARGQVVRTWEPREVAWSTSYAAPITSHFHITTTYDALGRITEVTRPDQESTRTYYNALDVAVIDARNHQSISAHDGLGRLISSASYVNAYTGDPGWSATPYIEATYAYNALDLLEEVEVDPSDGTALTTEITYDAMGRKTAMEDPDMGEWSYAYDRAGNLIRQEDARGKVIYLYYDELNRLIGKDYCTSGCGANPPANPTYDVEYEYDHFDPDDSDGSVSFGKGRLWKTEVAAGDVRRSYAYDERGRVDGEWLTVGTSPAAHGFRRSWIYNAHDQVTHTNLPGGDDYDWGEWLYSGYDAYGRPATLTGTVAYVTDASYDAQGRLTRIKYGNDNATDYVYRASNC